ncbi:MAG: hypothetical protein NZ869_00995 [Thermoanaerobaculum sp.]|nr:hypothetical protein [Thermoanaerobaculum sp.]
MFALCLLWAVAAGLGEPAPTIVAIHIVRHDVFDLTDPQTSSWPYRAANALHTLSRERFIRSLLLFREGDPWDPQLAAESERILRGTGFLNPVHIYPKPVAGGVEVYVETRDQFTLELAVNYGRLGRRQKAGISISEENFLGWGKNVYLDARSDPERDSITAGYSDPMFFGTRWRLSAAHREASDGTANEFSLSYPFFSLATPRAGGVTVRRESLVEYLWANGKKVVSGDTLRRSLVVWGGMRLPGNGDTTRRLVAGIFAERAAFSRWRHRQGSPYPEPEDRELVGLQVGFESQASRWEVVKGFRGWWRQEDIPLGPNVQLMLGVSLPALGGDRLRLPYEARYFRGFRRDSWYRWLSLSSSGRWEEGAVVDGVSRLEVGAAQVGEGGLRLRGVWELGHRLGLDRQLTLGANTGLRGWDPDTFDGTSRAVVNLEWRRRLTGEVLHVAVLGVVLFGDVGRTWGARVGADTGGWRANAGIGLLAEITRASVLRVVRLELAWPDRGGGPILLLTGVSLF